MGGWLRGSRGNATEALGGRGGAGGWREQRREDGGSRGNATEVLGGGSRLAPSSPVAGFMTGRPFAPAACEPECDPLVTGTGTSSSTSHQPLVPNPEALPRRPEFPENWEQL